MTAHKRRWPCSLQTLFAVVTVFGMILAWGAYELNLVRERLAMAQEVEGFGGEVCCYPYNTHPQVGAIGSIRCFVFGDLPASYIYLPREDFREAKTARVKALFPNVMVAHFSKKTLRKSRH